MNEAGYYYIDFLNKDNRFREERIKFLERQCAVEWGKANLYNYHEDMIGFHPLTTPPSKEKQLKT